MDDIDNSWDGKGSLQEHREAKLKDENQPGFGAQSDKAKKREPEPRKSASVTPKAASSESD